MFSRLGEQGGVVKPTRGARYLEVEHQLYENEWHEAGKQWGELDTGQKPSRRLGAATVATRALHLCNEAVKQWGRTGHGTKPNDVSALSRWVATRARAQHLMKSRSGVTATAWWYESRARTRRLPNENLRRLSRMPGDENVTLVLPVSDAVMCASPPPRECPASTTGLSICCTCAMTSLWGHRQKKASHRRGKQSP